ncbi:MAG: hypothetical protein PHW83_03490 [Bacteroidales bacterium]|nr:hypothetical protein [Bacteroidales bacterium]
MKLEKILSNLNSFEKNSFLKIIDGIIADKPRNIKDIDKILTDNSRDLKNVDNINIVKVFNLITDEFLEFLKEEFVKSTSQLDILTDIVTRDGNSIMRQEWFSRLYDKELLELTKKIKSFSETLANEKSNIDESRKRDYNIYKACLQTAYENDLLNNQEKKITSDEQSILLTLSKQLGLSQEEVKLINYIIIPIKKYDIDTVINDLKSIGVIFYSKKNNMIYIPDEVEMILRKLRGKEISDKHFRRVLRQLKDSQLNYICRKHGIDWKQPNDIRIKQIINIGVSFTKMLSEDIHKEGTKITEKKKFLVDLCENNLKIATPIKGNLLEEKIENLIKYFEDIEKDDKVGISIDGYEKLLTELGESIPEINETIRIEFELQEESVLKSSFLMDFNIKPRDVLELLTNIKLEEFCKTRSIKTRGDLIQNILENYKDAQNLFLENYENIAYRNLAGLKENGITIKEAELGIRFEDLTKTILTKLGFNVDEKLRKSLNTAKDKIDIVINLENSDLILVECKTLKESGYNKFSQVSRQLKAYSNLASGKGFKVIKSLLIAPDFSDDFVKECGLEYELNLSLITAASLLKILNGFKESKLKVFPYNLLMRDVQIQEDRVLKAICK